MPILSGTPPLSAEQMAQLRVDQLAMQAVLSGAFDDHIAQMKRIQADITVKQEALIALDQANTVRSEADMHAKVVKANSDSLFDRANKTLSAAENRAEQVARQQKEIDAALLDLKARQEDFAARHKADRESLERDRDATSAAIKAANNELAKREAALDGAQKQLIEAQQKLIAENAETAALKAQLSAKLDAFAKL